MACFSVMSFVTLVLLSNQRQLSESPPVPLYENEEAKSGSILQKSHLTELEQAIQNELSPEERAIYANRLQDRNRPPLSTLIDSSNGNITGDVSFLLDFVIAGFGKCGTSTIMHWLASHPEIQSFHTEIGELMNSRPDNLVKMLYNQLPAGQQYKRGYKSPLDVTEMHVLNYFRTLFPKAGLIVGIRHPIRYYESLYNFRVQNLGVDTVLPKPRLLIGRCTAKKYNTCTDKANFGFHLIRLGKQNYNQSERIPTELENEMIRRHVDEKETIMNITSSKPLPNPIFLFELDQLADTNTTRTTTFRKDLQDFLGLKQPLPTIPHHRPGRSYTNPHDQKILDQRKIDICDDEHISVRRELLVFSQQTSEWIQTTFLNSPGVYVSSRDYLDQLLKGWKEDPCGNTQKTETIILNKPMLQVGHKQQTRTHESMLQKLQALLSKIQM